MKRGENIYLRKDGRWEGRYIKGRTVSGRAVFGSVYGKSYKAVKAKLLPLKLAHTTPVGGRYSGLFSGWLRCWLEGQSGKVKESTQACYHRQMTLHILPALGDIPLQKLSAQTIQDFVNQLANKGLAPSTVNGIFRIVSAAVQKAADEFIIPVNVCAKIELPKGRIMEVEALTRTEQEQLETVAAQDKNGLAALLSLYTGMRVGEISALRWEDVDLENGLIQVRRTAQRISLQRNKETKTSVIFGPPKSASSMRLIPLPQTMTDCLKKHRETAVSEYVITSRRGFAEPRVLQYRLQSLIKKAGITPTRFHALRHSYATRCIELHIDITTLSKNLGHASTKMTFDVYTHASLEHRKEAVQDLNTLYQNIG